MDKISVAIGPTRRRMAPACVSLFNETLVGEEIRQMPCLCRKYLQPLQKFTCPSEEEISHQAGMPRFGYVTGYWPFDLEAGLDDIANGIPNDGTQKYHLVVNNETGPFHERGTAFTVSQDNPQPLAIYRTAVGIPKQFTISFYFRSKTVSGSGNFFSIKHHPSNFSEPNFEIGFSKDSMLVSTFGSMPRRSYAVEILRNKWQFLAVTFDGRNLKFHHDSGDVFKNLENFEIPDFADFGDGFEHSSRERFSDFVVGPITKDDQISCAIFWRVALSEAEIGRIPCVCRTRGHCNDQSDKDRRLSTKKFPNEQHLVAFWPMDDVFHLKEISQGKFPFFISENARLQRLAGQYGYGSLKVDQPLLEMEQRERFDSMNWTISFKFLGTDYEKQSKAIEISVGNETLFSMSFTASAIHLQPFDRQFSVTTGHGQWTYITVTSRSVGNETCLLDTHISSTTETALHSFLYSFSTPSSTAEDDGKLKKPLFSSFS